MQRFKTLFWRLAGVMTAAAALALAPAIAQAQPLVTVSGGGTASFDEVPGLTSQFAIGAVIRGDGTTEGRFVCMIVGIVAVTGDITDGKLNQDGSVTFTGVGHGIEHTEDGPVPFEDCDFSVTLRAGGAGVGGFAYSDCVVPPPGDLETVVNGHIMIKVH